MKARSVSRGSLLLLLVTALASSRACSSPSSSGSGGASGSGSGGSGSGGASGGASGGTTGGASGGTSGEKSGGASGGASGGSASGGKSGGGSSSGGATGDGSGGSSGDGSGGGSGGAPVIQKLCASKTTAMAPTLLDFENYDGMVDPTMFAEAFGGTMPNTGTSYAGVYKFGDGVEPSLSLLAGHPPSNWAMSETVMQAKTWGMGGGVWMGMGSVPGCLDASKYKGVTFWVRGSSPTGTFSVNLDMESTVLPDAMNAAAGGTCAGTKDTCKSATKTDLPLTMDWAQVKIAWSDFTPGMSGTTSVVPDGNNITGIGWGVPLQFQLDPSVPADAAGPYVAVPGDLVINIDDLGFIE